MTLVVSWTGFTNLTFFWLCILYGRLQRMTIPDAVIIQFCPPEEEHSTARNMLRIIMQHICCYRIKELCIKLVILNNSIPWCTVRKSQRNYVCIFRWKSVGILCQHLIIKKLHCFSYAFSCSNWALSEGFPHHSSSCTYFLSHPSHISCRTCPKQQTF